MTNPLLDKFYELHPEKQPKPKVIKAENAKIGFELKPEFLEQLANRTSNTSVASNLTTYDPDSLKVSFHQVAGQLQTGDAKVVSMSMERDIMIGTKITFEVMVYE
jgi:hypothetical protein